MILWIIAGAMIVLTIFGAGIYVGWIDGYKTATRDSYCKRFTLNRHNHH